MGCDDDYSDQGIKAWRDAHGLTSPAPSEPPAETQQGGERTHCLNCATAGDPDPRRVHPAAECPWRPEAARPSADTETLRRVRELLTSADGSPVGDWYSIEAQEIRAALDGPR